MTKENDMRSAISGDEPPALNNDRAVTRIAATNQSAPLKVAAYCRVSTLMPEQQMSMESQEVHYRKAIEEHPGWALAGIYSDQRSGTDADSRPALQQLLQDSREGRVDLILTKSLSRFARNTTECLQMVRELLSLHVNILFEKENLDTRDTGSELLLTTLASVAEQESYSISDNLKWGIRKRFASGNYHPSIPPYGYRKGEKGLEIDPEEANIVREINEKLLSGIGASTIAAELNARGVNTGRNGYWSYQKVRDIAENLNKANGLPPLLVAFSNVICVTTPFSGVSAPASLAVYLRNRTLLVTGTRTNSGRTLCGRSRKSSTDSLHAFALLSPSLEPKSL